VRWLNAERTWQRGCCSALRRVECLKAAPSFFFAKSKELPRYSYFITIFASVAVNAHDRAA
jgi:hypothetical protein